MKKVGKNKWRSKSLAKTWTPRGEEKIITSATPLEDLCRALSISHDPCEVARMKTTSKRRGEEDFGTWRITRELWCGTKVLGP